MQVITVIHKYPRKNSEASVWVVEGAGTRTSVEYRDAAVDSTIKRLFCAHPITNIEHAEMIAAAWRIVIAAPEGQAMVNKAHEEGY
jgi:hypothetical protein